MAYEWQMTFNSGIRAAGLHFMASTAADANHGNSYLVWQNSTTINIYESIGNTMYNRANAGLVAANGQTYQYRVTYNNGVITVWRNGAQVLSWTDGSPLTSGNFVAWRTNQSNVSFDNLRITGSSGNYNTTIFMHTDHLGSIGAVTSSGGALLDMTRFYPFGGYRGGDPTFLTERAFTGHKMNNTASNDLGLVYMNARFYSPTLARFISADTLVPDQNDPQALNRYAYARNNPLLLVDESGHCWGVASFVRNWNVTVGGTTYGMGVNCNNIDMAVDIATHPDASPEDKEKAQSYLGLWGVAAFAGTVGTGGLVCSTVAPCLAAANTALGLCRDGDCGNEIQAGLTGFSRASEFGIRSYSQLRNLTRGQGLHAHHIVPQRFARTLGLNSDDMASVALTPQEHQIFTNAWQTMIGYNGSGAAITTSNATISNIWVASQNIYSQHPTLLEAARQTLWQSSLTLYANNPQMLEQMRIMLFGQ